MQMRAIVQGEHTSTASPFADDNVTDTVYGPPPPDDREQRRIAQERLEQRKSRRHAQLFRSSTGSSGELQADLGSVMVRPAPTSSVEDESVACDPLDRKVCEACTKKFVDSSSLSRHLRNFPVCQRWIDSAPQSGTASVVNIAHLRANPNLTGSSIAMALGPEGLSKRVTPKGDAHDKVHVNDCGACGRAFQSTSALNRHFKSSLVCDRMRANTMLESLVVASEQCVANAHASDNRKGKRPWGPADDQDIVGQVGVR